MDANFIIGEWPHKWYGLWKTTAYPDDELPLISTAIDPGWNPPDKGLLVAYLQHSPTFYNSTPQVPCLLCGTQHPQINYKSDDVWLWPSSLAHYVAEHHVVLPDTFVKHIRERNYSPPERIETQRWLLPWPDSWTVARLSPDQLQERMTRMASDPNRVGE